MSHYFSQKTFAASLNLPYPLLSDYPDGKTILRWGVEQYEGRAKRLYARQSFFLVDKEGIVRGVWSQRRPKEGEVRSPDPLFGSEPILKLARQIAGK